MLLTLLAATPASAYWPDAQLGAVNAVGLADGALAADGTPVVGWAGADGVYVRVGSGSSQRVGDRTLSGVEVVAGGDQFALIWGTESGNTRVATGTVGTGVSATTPVAGFLNAGTGRHQVVMNRAGDLALLLDADDGMSSRLIWRPSGGTFATPIVTPAPPYSSNLSVSPDGEALVAWIGEQGPTVASSVRGAAFSEPVVLPLSSPSQNGRYVAPEVALDAHGRAVAAWVQQVQCSTIACTGAPSIAIRNGGTWRSASGVPGEMGIPLRVGTGDDGQAVVGWQDGEIFTAAAVSLASGAVGRQDRFDVPVRTFRDIAPDFHGTLAAPELAVGADGTASLVWSHDRSVLIAKRTGTGAFEPPVSAGCQFLFVSVPKSLGIDSSGRGGALFEAYPGGELATVREAAGPGPAWDCRPPEPGSLATFRPTLTTTPDRVLVGEPVRVAVTNTRAPNSMGMVGSAWYLDNSTLIGGGDRVTLTFDRPGTRRVSIHARQNYEGLGPTSVGWNYDVNVYAPATLTAAPRQHGQLRVRASALTYGPRVAATLIARRKGRVRARATGLLGLEPRRVDLGVETAGRYLVELRQASEALTRVRVRVR